MSPVTVVIIEDELDLASIQLQTLNGLKGFSCTQIYTDPQQFLLANVKADIVLLDLVMPNMDGMTALPLILKKYPNTAVIINSVKEDIGTILAAVTLGALGYIDKQSFFQSIEIVLKHVQNGGAYMTPKVATKIFEYFKKAPTYQSLLTARELEVASYIKDGMSYKQIAEVCYISIDTVRMHIRNIYKKLNINSKIQLANLISLPGKT
jgi:DNA-binding NarL/FixJ family response regulator